MQEREQDLNKLELIYLKNSFHQKLDSQYSRLNLSIKEVKKEVSGLESANQALENSKEESDRVNELNEFLSTSSVNITVEDTGETLEVLGLLNQEGSLSKGVLENLSDKYPSKLLLLSRRISRHQYLLLAASISIILRLLFELFPNSKTSVDLLSDNIYLYNTCYICGIFILTYNVLSLYLIRRRNNESIDDTPNFYYNFLFGRLMFSFAICFICIKMFRFFNFDMYLFTQSFGEDGDINGKWYIKVLLLAFDFSLPPLTYTTSANLLKMIFEEKNHLKLFMRRHLVK